MLNTINKGQCQVEGGTIAFTVLNNNAQGVPIIVVPGGPGMPHNYLSCLADQLGNHPVIFYDPLDCGLSDRTDNHELWSLDHFVGEIEALRRYLGLDCFHIYAHSFGTIISFEYAITFPQGLERLILASPILSVQRYRQDLLTLISTFPSFERNVLHSLLVDSNSYSSDSIQQALAYFAENHMCRLTVWPQVLLEASMYTNTKLRNYLWGQNDFEITGVLKNYDKLNYCAQFENPTLLIAGEYDFITPKACEYYASLMPNAVASQIDQAAHHACLESSHSHSQVVNDFLS